MHRKSKEGRLAQLVQSVCLTSRGSGVRIPQRPPRKPSCLLQNDLNLVPTRSAIKENRNRKGALSSAGSERLPYKQRVGGSNPSAPTKHNGAIAQLVEQRTENPCVPGSIPGGTTPKIANNLNSRLLAIFHSVTILQSHYKSHY